MRCLKHGHRLQQQSVKHRVNGRKKFTNFHFSHYVRVSDTISFNLNGITLSDSSFRTLKKKKITCVDGNNTIEK